MVDLSVISGLTQIGVSLLIISALVIYDGFVTKKLNNPAIKSWSLFIVAQFFISLCGILLTIGSQDLHELMFTTQQIIYALRTPFLLSLFYVYHYFGIQRDENMYYNPHTYKKYVKLLVFTLSILALCKGFRTEQFTMIVSMCFEMALLIWQQIGYSLVYKEYDLGNKLKNKNYLIYKSGLFAMYGGLSFYGATIVYLILPFVENGEGTTQQMFLFINSMVMSLMFIIYSITVRFVGQFLFSRKDLPEILSEESEYADDNDILL